MHITQNVQQYFVLITSAIAIMSKKKKKREKKIQWDPDVTRLRHSEIWVILLSN